MKKTFRRIIALTLIGTLLVGSLGACKKKEDSKVKKIKVAVAGGFYPITYADDNGKAQGYDVEVLKAVDELLEDYEFTYEITDKETMNVGVQSGTYQVGINSLFKTAARTETYYIPENNAGYTAVGIIHRKGEDINSFDKAYKYKPYLVNAAGGIRLIYDTWNEANPNKKIDYTLNTEFSYADLFASIRSGDYDYAADLIPVFNLQKSEAVEDLEISEPVSVIPTYPIVNKSESELGNAINDALKTLKDNGTLSKISKDTFGYDVFELADKK